MDPSVARSTVPRACPKTTWYAPTGGPRSSPRVCAPPPARRSADPEHRERGQGRQRRDRVPERRRMDERLNGYGDAGTDVWVVFDRIGVPAYHSEKSRRSSPARAAPGAGWTNAGTGAYDATWDRRPRRSAVASSFPSAFSSKGLENQATSKDGRSFSKVSGSGVKHTPQPSSGFASERRATSSGA